MKESSIEEVEEEPRLHVVGETRGASEHAVRRERGVNLERLVGELPTFGVQC
jgi:hypothetical protein